MVQYSHNIIAQEPGAQPIVRDKGPYLEMLQGLIANSAQDTIWCRPQVRHYRTATLPYTERALCGFCGPVECLWLFQCTQTVWVVCGSVQTDC